MQGLPPLVIISLPGLVFIGIIGEPGSTIPGAVDDYILKNGLFRRFKDNLFFLKLAKMNKKKQYNCQKKKTT